MGPGAGFPGRAGQGRAVTFRPGPGGKAWIRLASQPASSRCNQPGMFFVFCCFFLFRFVCFCCCFFFASHFSYLNFAFSLEGRNETKHQCPRNTKLFAAHFSFSACLRRFVVFSGSPKNWLWNKVQLCIVDAVARLHKGASGGLGGMVGNFIGRALS